MAATPAVRQALAALKTTAGERLYPNLAWGGNPGTVNGLPVDFNRTVAVGDTDQVIVGDFANMFKWGYAKEIPLEVIPYGDPDNTGVDLKGSNQVYLRAEVYLGWGILDEKPSHGLRTMPKYVNTRTGAVGGDRFGVLRRGLGRTERE